MEPTATTRTAFSDVLVREVGLNEEDASFWSDATDFDEEDPEEYRLTDAQRLDEIRLWLERFPSGTAKHWFMVGVTVDQAAAWADVGFAPWQAKEVVDTTWLRAFNGTARSSLDAASEQDRWLQSHLSPDEVLGRLRRGEVAPR